MPREPVFEEPPDILDELTEPVPRARPTARPGPSQAKTPTHAPIPTPDTGQAAATPQPSSATQPVAQSTTASPTAETGSTPEPVSRRNATSKSAPASAAKKRVAPNVALYLTPAQKRELMILKAEIDMDYTAIVVDALKARHPRRRW